MLAVSVVKLATYWWAAVFVCAKKMLLGAVRNRLVKVFILLTSQFNLLNNKTILVKTCNKLPIPKHGMMKCEQSDLGAVYDNSEANLPVDTVCNFECKNGTLQIGSKQRVCLPIAQWDGLRTICKRKKCFPQN